MQIPKQYQTVQKQKIPKAFLQQDTSQLQQEEQAVNHNQIDYYQGIQQEEQQSLQANVLKQQEKKTKKQNIEQRLKELKIKEEQNGKICKMLNVQRIEKRHSKSKSKDIDFDIFEDTASNITTFTSNFNKEDQFGKTQIIRNSSQNSFYKIEELLSQSNNSSIDKNSQKEDQTLYPLQAQYLKKLEHLRKKKVRNDQQPLTDFEADLSTEKQYQEYQVAQNGEDLSQKEKKYEEYKQQRTQGLRQNCNDKSILQSTFQSQKQKRVEVQSPNHAGERLYQYSQAREARKNFIREIIQNTQDPDCTFKPNINKYSKNLSNRSYLQSPTSNSQKEQKNVVEPLITFQPVIDKKSKQLAEKKGKAFDRLLSPKSEKKPKLIPEETHQPNINKLSNQLVQRDKNVFDSLYQKGKMHQKKLEQKKQNLEKSQMEQEAKDFTFKPQINSKKQKQQETQEKPIYERLIS